MKDNYCRCCLSEECLIDMANNYCCIDNKLENCFDMLLNVFNINIQSDTRKQCLICEDCVSKLQEAATFKYKVLNTQDIILKLSPSLINDYRVPKVENQDNPDSTEFDDTNFVWSDIQEQTTQNERFVIKLERPDDDENLPISTIQKIYGNNNSKSEGSDDDENLPISTIQKINSNNKSTKDLEQTPSNTVKQIKKPSAMKKSSKGVRNKKRTDNQNQDPISKWQRTKNSENTLKLIEFSNLCIFRSLQNKFGCYLCKSTYLDISKLREHSITHANPKRLSRKIRSLRGLSYKNADISNLECKICTDKISNLPDLISHLQKHDIQFMGTKHFLIPYKLELVSKDGFQCVLCDEKYLSYMKLSIHMNSHYTHNVCEICGLSFINRLSLRAHFNSQHTKKKCSICPTFFFTNSAKVKHMRIAHSIQNFKYYCNICQKTFRYTYKLEEHKIEEHGAKRQILNCEQCGKSFIRINNLRIHIRSVHIKERNYSCSVCEMRFFTKSDQKRHELTHEDVKSFSCSRCDSKFKYKDSMRRHLKTLHGNLGKIS